MDSRAAVLNDQTTPRKPESATSHQTSAAGTGALIASLWLAGRGTVSGLTSLVVTALLAVALAVSGFVVTDWFPLALGSIALLGAAGVIGGTGTQTLMQHVVDGGMRGWVMSRYGLIHRGGPAVGALAMGAAADLIGIRLAVASGAVLCIGLWLWMIRRQKETASVLEIQKD